MGVLRGPTRFVADTHEYFIGDVRVPGISEILEAGGECDPKYYTREGKIRGAEVHRLCLDYDLGVLEDDFDSPYRKWVLSYKKIKPDLHVEWTELETISYSRRLRCATRIDRIGFFKPPSPFAGRWCIADFKSGAKEEWHGIQLAGGDLIRDHRQSAGEGLVRLSLYLKGTGRGQAFVQQQVTDRDKFLRALATYWKRVSHDHHANHRAHTVRSRS